jgi:hypothetical protein
MKGWWAGATLVAAATTWTGVSRAQQESAAAGLAEQEDEARSKPPPTKASSVPPEDVSVRGEPRSPEWTQARPFGTTRVWLLDPGAMDFEAWYTLTSAENGVSGQTKHLWQVEYMIAPVRGVQLDVYFNYQYDDEQGAHIQGAQIEGRFAPWRYGTVFGNPALYLEWHPQNRDANRAEVRLLLGGQIFTPRPRGAINPFVEQNVDAPAAGAPFLADREMGVAAAAGYGVVENALMLGGEIKAAADQEGTGTYRSNVRLGPSLWTQLGDGHFHVTAMALAGVTATSNGIESTMIVGYRP